MEIPENLQKEIEQYCRANNIPNIDEFTLKLIKQGFTVEKFGATPSTKEKIVEKIIEKIIEVPVEKIVEKRVEVPVAMVDTELSENLKNYIEAFEKSQNDLKNAMAELMLTKEQLGIEQKKNNKDIYGEN